MNLKNLKFNNLIYSFEKIPRDVHTYTLTNRTPLWFYCYVENNTLYVETVKEHEPKSIIKNRLKIEDKQFDAMLKLYKDRLSNKQVSSDALNTTFQSVYWYGIIADVTGDENYKKKY